MTPYAAVLDLGCAAYRRGESSLLVRLTQKQMDELKQDRDFARAVFRVNEDGSHTTVDAITVMVDSQAQEQAPWQQTQPQE